MNGTCRLCRQRTLLCESHVLPAWCYKRLLDSSQPNPHPILVEDGRASHSSRQVSKYMLCSYCEQRVGRWDNYAAKISLGSPNDPPPVLSAIGRLLGVASSGESRLHDTDSIDVDQLSKFALSIVWRAHHAGVLDRGLGRFDEPLRQYLLDRVKSAPRRIDIVVSVLDPKFESHGFHRVVSFPTTRVEGKEAIVGFLLFGLVFDVFLDGDAQALAECSFLKTGRVLLTAPMASGVVRSIATAAEDAVEVGSLGRRGARK